MPIDAIFSMFHQWVSHPYFLILLTLWLTYSYILVKGGFCSDDIQGIEQYDGTLMYPDEANPGKKVRKVSYGTLSKWVRYHLSGGNHPSRHHYKKPDGSLGDPIPSGKVPSHHHALSVVCQSVAVILLYQFLLLVTTPTVALLTTLLFIVHPICTQAVAWPSAIGYILSLICITASLNISYWTMAQTHNWMFILGLGGLAFFQVWGVYAQAIPMFTWVILLVLGQWQMALVAALFSGLAASRNLREYVVYRRGEFKKQNMENSTSFNIRKPIVALKTIAYYIYMAFWPAKMGLYHEWGFHYSKKMELWDWRAICGLGFIIASTVACFMAPIEVRLGLVWFTIFLFLFLNWITAQQWVTERYLYIPVIGLCLVTSYLLQCYQTLYWFIFGMLLCRTLCHLPTYDNELRFYISNTWNFPKSEVAYGNLGVTYAGAGLAGAANDMWVISASLNKDYDVPQYNIFSRAKSQGFMMIQNGAYEQGLATIASSIPILQRVLACKVLHFPDMWKKELEDIRAMVSNPIQFLGGELNRLQNLKESLMQELYRTKDDKRKGELTESLNNNETQMTNLISYLKSKGVNVDFDPQKAILSKLTQRRA